LNPNCRRQRLIMKESDFQPSDLRRQFPSVWRVGVFCEPSATHLRKIKKETPLKSGGKKDRLTCRHPGRQAERERRSISIARSVGLMITSLRVVFCLSLIEIEAAKDRKALDRSLVETSRANLFTCFSCPSPHLYLTERRRGKITFISSSIFFLSALNTLEAQKHYHG